MILQVPHRTPQIWPWRLFEGCFFHGWADLLKVFFVGKLLKDGSQFETLGKLGTDFCLGDVPVPSETWRRSNTKRAVNWLASFGWIWSWRVWSPKFFCGETPKKIVVFVEVLFFSEKMPVFLRKKLDSSGFFFQFLFFCGRKRWIISGFNWGNRWFSFCGKTLLIKNQRSIPLLLMNILLAIQDFPSHLFHEAILG